MKQKAHKKLEDMTVVEICSQLRRLPHFPSEWTDEYIQRRALEKYLRQHHAKADLKNRMEAKKNEILRRDGFQCHYCKKRVRGKDATLDHKIPIIRGGDTTKANMVTCCDECNNLKGDMTDVEFFDLQDAT